MVRPEGTCKESLALPPPLHNQYLFIHPISSLAAANLFCQTLKGGSSWWLHHIAQGGVRRHQLLEKTKPLRPVPLIAQALAGSPGATQAGNCCGEGRLPGCSRRGRRLQLQGHAGISCVCASKSRTYSRAGYRNGEKYCCFVCVCVCVER